jgi:hypothetical protein
MVDNKRGRARSFTTSFCVYEQQVGFFHVDNSLDHNEQASVVDVLLLIYQRQFYLFRSPNSLLGYAFPKPAKFVALSSSCRPSSHPASLRHNFHRWKMQLVIAVINSWFSQTPKCFPTISRSKCYIHCIPYATSHHAPPTTNAMISTVRNPAPTRLPVVTVLRFRSAGPTRLPRPASGSPSLVPPESAVTGPWT